jgi:hypothetical protein
MHGTRQETHVLTIRAVTRAYILCIFSLLRCLSGKPGIPYMCADDLMAHQEDPGGPRLAVDQLEHWASRQTPSMHPLRIHPRITDTTTGLVKSNSGPCAMSKAEAAKPSLRKQAETFPETANSTRNNLRVQYLAERNAVLKCVFSLFWISCADRGCCSAWGQGPGLRGRALGRAAFDEILPPDCLPQTSRTGEHLGEQSGGLSTHGLVLHTLLPKHRFSNTPLP